LLAEIGVPAAVTLIESDPQAFDKLTVAVGNSADASRLGRKPVLIHGEFGEHVDRVLRDPVYGSNRSVATFAFIDPCGIKGVRLRDIAQVLKRPFGECLVLWNYSGVNRWLGAAATKSERPAELVEFFGGQEELSAAFKIQKSGRSPDQIESSLRELFVRSLRQQSGAKYFLPFRFEAPDANRTSHYLIHCSGHHRAFVVMKEIMHGESKGDGDVGQFAFITDAENTTLPLFLPSREIARAAVLKELEGGVRPVQLFFEDWVDRPDDFMTRKQYKELLLELERENLITVVDPETGAIAPPGKRTRNGQVTLGEKWAVRVRKRQ
jgi:three-Cys-motif partner protein